MTSRLFSFKLLIFYAFCLTLLTTSCNLFDASKTYYVLADNVRGMSTKTNVEIAGIKVGQVEEISLMPNLQVLLEFTVDEEVNISSTTQAVLMPDGYMGERILSLRDTLATPPYYSDGDTLTSKVVYQSLHEAFYGDMESPFLLDSLTGKQLDSLLTEELVPQLRSIIKAFTEKAQESE